MSVYNVYNGIKNNADVSVNIVFQNLGTSRNKYLCTMHLKKTVTKL